MTPKMSDDELHLGADHYLSKLMDRKTFSDHFWSGIRAACLAVALILSIYSLILSTRAVGASSGGGAAEELASIKAAQLRDDQREDNQLGMIRKLRESLSAINVSSYKPVMFDCYRTSRLNRAAVVTFDGCFVDMTTGQMNPDTGIFRIDNQADTGIYHISFTAKYVSSSKGRFGAWSDIYVNETVVADSQREYNGNERSTSESSTHTVAVLYPLVVGDVVKVQFNKDGNSYIHSDDDHDVHFIARKVAEIPVKETTTRAGEKRKK